MEQKNRRSACRERTLYTNNIVIPAKLQNKKPSLMHKQKPKKKRTKEKQLFCKMEADKGLYEILQKDTEVVAAAGGDPTKAFQLLLIENYQNWLKHK
jgi:flotillin